MQEIDFLPSRYHERSQARRMMLWRVVTMGVAGLLILGGHLTQSECKRHLARQLDEIELAYVDALGANSRLQALKTELAATEQLAELYVYLQYPWPRTQLLAAISQTRPQHITLTEIQLTDVPGVSGGTVSGSLSAADPGKPPAKRDVDVLREQNSTGSTFVAIKGMTSDISALQQYVAGFRQSPFFATAKLESLESLKQSERPNESRFELRLETKPGYCHPHGPPSLTMSGTPEIASAGLLTPEAQP